MYDDIKDYWRELTLVMQLMPFSALEHAAELLLDCHRRKGMVFIFGNGGSASTASHFACDLAKGTQVPGLPAFRVMALNDNVPLLTAWANDTSYDRVFAEHLSTLVRPGDLVIAISASGNSPNVLAAVRMAQQSQATTIALTGRSGGKLYCLADITIRVPARSIEQVEDAHLVVAHSLCVVLRRHLYAQAALQEVEHSVLNGIVVEPAVADLNS